MADIPYISIITPVYNVGQYLEETIASVQNQTYSHWEHIIIDDASTDDSLKIIKKAAQADQRICYQSLPQNKGAAYARNLATEMAKGTYIAFLDADDLWHPEKLEKQLDFMQTHKGKVSYTSYIQIDEQGNSLHKRIKARPQLTYRQQLANNYVGNLTGIYHVASLGKITTPNLRKRQDWALWLEAIKRSNQPALGLQKDLAYYRVRKGGLSASKWKLIPYNFAFYRKHLGFSFLKSVLWLVRFFYEYFVVRSQWIESTK